MKNYLVNIPIIRKNFEKTNSAKFKGIIKIICNKYGVISSWKIKFSYLSLDLFTTPSWFNKKNKNFERREDLFSRLKIQQKPRPRRFENKNRKLTKKELKIANDYFSNNYDSTLKNILAVIKGNNPGGEAKKPNSAEMVIDFDSNTKNFVILLDDLTTKDKRDFDVVVIGAEKLSFIDFVNLNDELKSAFDFMQKEKEKDSWIYYLNNIKKYYKKYNIDFSKAQALANRARGKFGKNVQNIEKLPFNLISSIEFQKCHIYEFHNLRDKILEALRENKSTKKYEDMISDPNNFIPLPEMLHRKFDSNYFTYTLDGKIKPINSDGVKFIEKYVDDQYKKIPEFFLNKKRKEYFLKRNEALNNY